MTTTIQPPRSRFVLSRDEATIITETLVDHLARKSSLAAVWQEVLPETKEAICRTWAGKIRRKVNHYLKHPLYSRRRTPQEGPRQLTLNEVREVEIEIVNDLERRGGLAETWWEMDDPSRRTFRATWVTLIRNQVNAFLAKPWPRTKKAKTQT